MTGCPAYYAGSLRRLRLRGADHQVRLRPDPSTRIAAEPRDI